MKNIFKLKKCEICNKNLVESVKLGLHPLCDDLIKINSKKNSVLYPITISYCKKCVTAYQKYQVKKKILFPKNYHYRAKLTQDVINGQKLLVKDLKLSYGNLKKKTVLDIGSNDGTLLDFFAKEKAKTIGIEPTNAYKEMSKKHIVFHSYLNENLCKKIIKKFKKIDVITFTNVFAHIENLNEVLKCLQILISKNTIIVIENHYLGSIIDKNQFDTFYHEHPRTYSLTSFLKISEKIKMKVSKFLFPKRYGGNIRVILSKSKSDKKIKYFLNKENKFFKKLLKLNTSIKIWRKNKRKEIYILQKKFGKLPAKAFPGRAAILLKLLGLNESQISGIYEKRNSMKIGHYAPATRIKIISDSYLKKINNKVPIINLAWHIDREIKTYLKKMRIKNKVINILDRKDFNK